MAAVAFPAGLEDLNRFVSALFRHADEDSFISLRAFDQKDRGVPPILIEGVLISEGTASIVTKAARASMRAANRSSPGVFAPPVATFNNPNKAGEADMANGVAISVEIDAGDPLKARRILEHLLGPVTIALHSGSEWLDPETGEIHPKTHLHWRLSEPTRTTEEHVQLKRARWAAATLVGADMTAAPPCHPLRWPGSWNLKGTPRRAQIYAGNEASEVHLLDVLEKLEEAVEGAGLKLDRSVHNPGKDPQARIEQVRASLSIIPNTACNQWHDWNRMGMIVWRATGGSTEGLNAWSDWCAKDGGTDEGCAERWAAISTSPPSMLGYGSLVYMARQQTALGATPPEEICDEGYYASLEADAVQEWEIANKVAALPAGTSALWSSSDDWDENEIPTRPWIAKGYLMRGSVSVLAGAGSAGKSSLGVVWGIALALGVTWSRFKPIEPCVVSLYNVEDDDDEQKRRLSAALRQFRSSPVDLKEKLYRLGPNNIGTLIERDPMTHKLRFTAAMNELIEHLEAARPRVLILDPLVALHNLDENDNTALRGVMATLRAIAKRFDLSVLLVHHARKGSSGAPGDPDTIRGAADIVGAARVAMTVCTMTDQEADELGVEKTARRDYFRLDGAKQNYAPVDQAEWFHRIPYELENGEQVVAAHPWKPPSVWKEMLPNDIAAVLDRIAAGPAPGVLYAPSNRGANNARWAGNPIMQIMKINETQAFGVVRAWLKSGLLYETTYRDQTARKDKPGVLVDRSKEP